VFFLAVRVRTEKIPRRKVEDRYDKWASAVIAICVFLVMKKRYRV
jgi:hypothetical protein